MILPSQLAKCEFGRVVFAINKSSTTDRAHVNLSARLVTAAGDAPLIICRVIQPMSSYSAILADPSAAISSGRFLLFFCVIATALQVTQKTPDSPTLKLIAWYFYKFALDRQFRSPTSTNKKTGYSNFNNFSDKFTRI